MIDYKALHDQVFQPRLEYLQALYAAFDKAMTSMQMTPESFDTPQQALDALLAQERSVAEHFALERATAAVPERNLIQEVAMERERQDEKWGRESDDQKAPFDWCRIIQDYAGWARTMAGMDNPEKYRKRMIQIAAIAVAAIESHDRRMGAAAAPAEPESEE